jgi:predicted nucleotide-binding protein
VSGWTADQARDTLRANGIAIKTEGRTGNDKGTEFRCNEGPIVQVYDTGKVVVQGKNQELVRHLFGVTNSDAVPQVPAATPQTIATSLWFMGTMATLEMN